MCLLKTSLRARWPRPCLGCCWRRKNLSSALIERRRPLHDESMSKVIKAQVLTGQFSGQTVRITNISLDEMGRQKAACILPSGQRVNLPVKDLEVIPEAPEPEIRKAKTASMPFIS